MKHVHKKGSQKNRITGVHSKRYTTKSIITVMLFSQNYPVPLAHHARVGGGGQLQYAIGTFIGGGEGRYGGGGVVG